MTHNTREEGIKAWKKLAREKLAPNVTYIDPKFKEGASWAEALLNAFWVEQQKDLDAFIDTFHQELQKTRTAEQERVVGILQNMKGVYSARDVIEKATEAIMGNENGV